MPDRRKSGRAPRRVANPPGSHSVSTGDESPSPPSVLSRKTRNSPERRGPAEAPLLPVPFVQENFEFYGKVLTGAKEIRPRWKRCVSLVDLQLGEALGQIYVDRAFGVEGKQRTLKMTQAIEAALARDINELTWMTPQTKQYALEKLRAVTNKIGYPDKWRDYSTVKIVRGDAIGN